MINRQIIILLIIIVILGVVSLGLFIRKKNSLIDNIVKNQRQFLISNNISYKNDYYYVSKIANSLEIPCNEPENFIITSRRELRNSSLKSLKSLSSMYASDKINNVEKYFQEIRKKIIENILKEGILTARANNSKIVTLQNKNHLFCNKELDEFENNLINLKVKKFVVISNDNGIQLISFYLDENFEFSSIVVANAISQLKKVKFANWEIHKPLEKKSINI